MRSSLHRAPVLPEQWHATRRLLRPTQRFVHSSGNQAATPIPHPPAPGPPPKPPVPSANFEGDRVARKRKQASLMKLGEQLKANPAKPGSALQKRFWKNVSVQETADGDYQIMLDRRAVRTPSRQALTIPRSKPQLATAIAIEWDSLVTAAQALKQHYIPLTSLAARALDLADAERAGDSGPRDTLVRQLMSYLDTDTLLCWVPHADAAADDKAAAPDSLRLRQERAARPIIAHLTTQVWPGVQLVPVTDEGSILARPQPDATTAVIRGWLAGLPPFELAGIERAVLATKSLCVAARLLVQWSREFAGGAVPDADAPRFGIEDAALAASQEVLWQTQMWGEVEDTHDVEREDIRRQLGAVVLLVHDAGLSSSRS